MPSARVREQQGGGGMRAGPQHTAHQAHVGDQRRAGPSARGIAPADGDAVQYGVGAHAPGQHARPQGPPAGVHRQLDQGAQAFELGQILAVGQQAGFQVRHSGLEALIFLAHAHQVEIALPEARAHILDVAHGLEHGAAQFQADIGGKVVQGTGALVPGIHTQKEDEQDARENQNTPQ